MKRSSQIGSTYDTSYLEIVENSLVYADNLADSAAAIVKSCAHALDVGRASFWLLGADGTEATCISLYIAASDEFEHGATLSQEQFPCYFEAIAGGRVLDAADACTDPRTSELAETYLKPLDVHSLLDATIRDPRDGQLRGVLCCEMVGARRAWTPQESMFAASMADLIAQRIVAVDWSTSTKIYQALFESSNDGIVISKGGSFVAINPAACAIHRGTAEELVGLSPPDLWPEFQPCGKTSVERSAEVVGEAMSGTPKTYEWLQRRLDGTTFDAEVSTTGILLDGERVLFSLVRDITFRKEAERQAAVARRQAEYQATHDSLTGLLNRRQLHNHVGELIENLQHPFHKIALVILDLNRFKEINDTLGHQTGDKVLVGVSNNLQRRVADARGALFRLGGDEFVAVFDSETCGMPIESVVFLINEALETPIEVGQVSFEMSASVGAALYPDHGSDSHELLRCADVAMYHTKSEPGSPIWYDTEIDHTDSRRLSMVPDLRRAIQQDELILHYQPRIRIKTGEVTGFEALVRWQHPEQGVLPPSVFLPVAEMTELIHPLTEWVFDAALQQIRRLRLAGYHLPVAINLSARNLPDSQLFDMIEQRLESCGIPPSCLEIEITESALINNPQRSLQNLLRLEALGVSIAIDDFGTGYSSLSLLRELPLDTLKIDRSFVDNIVSSPRDQIIVNTTISLAHNLSARSVAEGVEDQETLEALEASDCDEAQGYFIARPMPAAELAIWLAEYLPKQRTA